MLQGKAMPVACTGASIPSWVKKPLGKVISVVDHTYVECVHSGEKWGCHGRSSGGTTIGVGTKCVKHDGCIANCLYGNDEAGIRYLVTGVCHQIANRTLYPAEFTVKKAKGYFASRAIYGEYGYYKAAWERRKKVCFNIEPSEINHNQLQYALSMQLEAFSKYGMSEVEISDMFPGVHTNSIQPLKALTVNLRIKFLKLAIQHLKSHNEYLSFLYLIHKELNLFITLVVNELGPDYVQHLLNFKEYNENTYVLLLGSEFVE